MRDEEQRKEELALELMSERQRRTYLRLKAQGRLDPNAPLPTRRSASGIAGGGGDDDEDDFDDDDDDFGDDDDDDDDERPKEASAGKKAQLSAANKNAAADSVKGDAASSSTAAQKLGLWWMPLRCRENLISNMPQTR